MTRTANTKGFRERVKVIEKMGCKVLGHTMNSKDHPVIEIELPDGRVKKLTVPNSTSDGRRSINRMRCDIRKMIAGVY